MKCDACNREVRTHVEKRVEEYPVKGTPISIEATVRVCSECGKTLWDDDLDNQNLIDAFNEYRKMHNLLLPEEIRGIREMYGLSQKDFARVLGFGEKTITRYENGSLQDEAQNNLILLMKDKRNFEILLDKADLTKEEKAEFRVRANLKSGFQFEFVVGRKENDMRMNAGPNPAFSEYGAVGRIIAYPAA